MQHLLSRCQILALYGKTRLLQLNAFSDYTCRHARVLHRPACEASPPFKRLILQQSASSYAAISFTMYCQCSLNPIAG